MIKHDDYESFFNEVLSFLYKNFIRAAKFKDILIMSSIVNCLSDVLYNNYKVKSATYQTSTLFMDTEETKSMSEIDLSLAITAVQHFCKILLNVGPGNFRAMLSVMQFYEKLNAGESLYKLNATNIIPIEISHAFLVNPNALLLDRYANSINTALYLGQEQGLGADHAGLIAIAKQAKEIYIFLLRDPMTSQFIQECPIVRNSCLYRKVILTKVHGIYVLKHNLAFQHLTRLDQKGNLYGKEQVAIDLKRFQNACPHLMGLLATVKMTQDTK